MRVLVCGGRDYLNCAAVYKELDRINVVTPITLIIHGAAPGADILGHTWAYIRKIKAVAVPANWKEHGKKAGPLRNQLMIDLWKPDLVVAFPGGAGTADMIKRAERVSISVVKIVDKVQETV